MAKKKRLKDHVQRGMGRRLRGNKRPRLKFFLKHVKKKKEEIVNKEVVKG
jgi:hypothetical protein